MNKIVNTFVDEKMSQHISQYYLEIVQRRVWGIGDCTEKGLGDRRLYREGSGG